jgi:hypothetical protein
MAGPLHFLYAVVERLVRFFLFPFFFRDEFSEARTQRRFIMETLSIEPAVQHIKLIAPEYFKLTRAFLRALPRDWYCSLPVELQLHDGKVSRLIIAHAVLNIYAPHIYPVPQQTRRLAEFMLLQLAKKNQLFDYVPTGSTSQALRTK